MVFLKKGQVLPGKKEINLLPFQFVEQHWSCRAKKENVRLSLYIYIKIYVYTPRGFTIRFGKNQPPLAEVGCIYGFDAHFPEGTPVIDQHVLHFSMLSRSPQLTHELRDM